MTVYVDDMHAVPMGEFRGMKMSHMIADTEAELHAMAASIGVQRRWYQGDHYDIALSKRALAIRAGAVPVPLRVLARMAMNRRRGRPLGTPEEAAAALGETVQLSMPLGAFDRAIAAASSKLQRDRFVREVQARWPGAEVITVRDGR
ncbi:DUF4031 domain-containing protein [Pseudorhodoplanes sp.]|uniref:DUF4031 domain-containing protein n=1 Tax=Pseudorhodoplanes sp. TaxID=1934341 RepID=UPI003D1211ED